MVLLLLFFMVVCTVMMVMTMSIFIAHGSTNLNELKGGGGAGRLERKL